jgi:ComF family protein
VYVYDERVQGIIHALKYQGFRSLGIVLGELIASRVKSKIKIEPNTILVPVPLHPIKYRERGYNQSYFIAKGLGNILDLNIRYNMLKRIKNTITQTHLSALERHQNMKNAFKLMAGVDFSQIENAILVDDVFTTGATLNSAAGVLKSAGVDSVIGVTVTAPV